MMRGPLHLSFYLALASAMLCLALAEIFFLPWMPLLLAAVWISLLLAWLNEGRWELSEGAANSIGLVIAFVMIGWIVLQIPRSEEDLLAQGVPWPAGLLPYLGPLLMVLTAVKLFRPKRVPDFWVLQVLGLMMVTLASVLAGEFHHTAWLILYLVCLHWCLAQHYRHRSGLSAEHVQRPLFDPSLLARTSSRMEGLFPAMLQCAVTVMLGLAIFYAAPRHPSAQWVPHKLAASAAVFLATGHDGTVDLNHEGKIELSEEVAFEATSQDHAGRLKELAANSYWRGEVVDFYRQGRWLSASQSPELWIAATDLGDRTGLGRLIPVAIPDLTPVHPSQRPDDLAPDHLYLTLRTRPQMGNTLVLAEPPNPELGTCLNPHSGSRPMRSSILGRYQGTDVLATMVPPRRSGFHYGQVWNAAEFGRPRHAGDLHPHYRREFLLQAPPEGFGPWARNFLMRLRGLTESERSLDDEQFVSAPHHARVARIVAQHFAESGEYLYSLDLRRKDKSVDPILDFLANVKVGHCERYASGLVLVLRALGIPCRMVQGYRGSEIGEQKEHIVRFSHAHSWVEALVADPNLGAEVWIHLDPTPAMEAPRTGWQTFMEHVNESVRQTRNVFHHNILEFGAEGQAQLLQSLVDELKRLRSRETLLGGLTLAALAGAAWGLRRFLGHRGVARPRTELRVAWMQAFLNLAQRHGNLVPLPQQTWHEFVDSVRDAWANRLADDLTASLEEFARCADQVCYAGEPLSSERLADLNTLLGRLNSDLRARSFAR